MSDLKRKMTRSTTVIETSILRIVNPCLLIPILSL